MTDDPLEKLKSQHSYEAEETYTDEEQDAKQTAINKFLRKNEKFHENMLRIYDDATRNGDPLSTCQLYRRSIELNGVLVNILRDSEETDLAEKLEEEMEEMITTVPPNSLERPIQRSRQLNWASTELMNVVENHGSKMKQYSFWLLSGTQITSEASR